MAINNETVCKRGVEYLGASFERRGEAYEIKSSFRPNSGVTESVLAQRRQSSKRSPRFAPRRVSG